eukprot:13569962-Alexandrium_andersonii.AAC.1
MWPLADTCWSARLQGAGKMTAVPLGRRASVCATAGATATTVAAAGSAAAQTAAAASPQRVS